MLENITLNGSNVTAEIDAYIYHCLFGFSGVFEFGEQLRCETVTNNLLKIYDGLIINQGRFFRIVPGSYEEIKIANGTVGQKRYDLIVSHFETDGINENHDIRVISGINGKIPEVTQSNLFNGGTVNEVPLYLIELDGINIVSVKEQFTLIPSLNTLMNKMVVYEE